MCRNSCIAFTGPFANLDHCPKCNEPKLCPITKKPQLEFHTILLGPVLQALWRNASSAKKFYHRRWKTWEIIRELLRNSGHLSSYDDFYCGSDYLENVRSGKIQDNDIVLMLSIDGAQLYAHKTSDCWIYIWIIMDFSPEERYMKRHVIPGGFIPGKPKNIDSFYFQGCIMSAHFRMRVFVFGTLSRTKILPQNYFLHLTLQTDLRWPCWMA